MTYIQKTSAPLTKRACIIALISLLLLQGVVLALSLRYAYISTDVLAKTESTVLIWTTRALTWLTSYWRLALLLWCAFTASKRASAGMLGAALFSLFASGASDVMLACFSDVYFAGSEWYYILSAAISFVIGAAVYLVLWFIGSAMGKKFAKNAKKRYSLPALGLWSCLVTYLVDALYLGYILLTMLLSPEGLIFEGGDILYLIYDFTAPFAEAALGFGFICLCFWIFNKYLLKKAQNG